MEDALTRLLQRPNDGPTWLSLCDRLLLYPKAGACMRMASAPRLYQLGPLALCVVEQFDAPHSVGMVLFKIGILLFNLVPSIALRLVGYEVVRPYSVSHRDRCAPETVIAWMIQSHMARNCWITVSSCSTDNRMEGRRVIPSGGIMTPGSALRRWSSSTRFASVSKGGVVFII